MDSSGNVYFTGATDSSSPVFPLVNAFQSTRGHTEAFVAKLSSAGDGLLFSSYLGGGIAYFDDVDAGLGIAASDDGVVAVVGYTTSSTFNTVEPFQAEISVQVGAGGWDGVEGFVAKIDTVSGSLLYSSYLGGGWQDQATAVAMDASGVVYLTGFSFSDDFPLVSAYDDAVSGSAAIIMKISGNGSTDTTPPSVNSTNPVAGATAVPTSSTVTVTFNEAMDAATLDGTTFTVTDTGGAVGGVVSYDAGSMTATFTPAALLAANTLHQATITADATDVAGNALGSAHTWSFTTGAAPDTTKPTVQSTSPTDAATGVALNTTVSATFPHGLVSFTVEGVSDPRFPASVTIQFPTAFPAGAVYYKVDSSGFHPYPYAVFSGNTVTLDLYDDGQHGDLVAGDGVVQDPGGVAVPNASGNDDKGWQGGCFLRSLE